MQNEQKNMDLLRPLVRERIYLYLSNSFAYPGGDLVNEILFADYFGKLREWVSGLGINLGDDYSLDTAKDMSAEKLMEDLRIEYTRLFINAPGSSLPVPPFESCYKHREGLVMDVQTIDSILSFYKRAGLNLPEDFDLLPDHIAVELEFMAYLAKQEYVFGEKRDLAEAKGIIALEADFFNMHLKSWISEFCKKIKAESNQIFYHRLALITETFVLADKDHLVSI